MRSPSMRIVPDNRTSHAQLAWPRLASLDIVSSQQMLMRLAWTEDIRRLAVDRIITSQQLRLAHPQRDAQHVLDETHDERCPDHVPCDDEQGAVELEVHLLAVALDGAAGVGEAEGGAALDGREEADAHSAHEARDQVGVKDAKGVVDFAEVGDLLAHDVHA